ncbi:hypothetical protein [Streptomyces sp. NBC_01233]|uniref:hypothetical protein n=1 Tax=Streptomyces sp. NBC_01233 TaxID=2903787 RepID=UPI002E12E09F|nr:hypothetical protein OG332_46035 [Streptomyces sp. NBC_01233]
MHGLGGVDDLLVAAGLLGQGREPLGPLGLPPDVGLFAAGGRIGRLGAPVGGVPVLVRVEARGGGRPAQFPSDGPVPGGRDVRGVVPLGRLFGGEQTEEVVEAVAVTVASGVGPEQPGVGQVLRSPGRLADRQVRQAGGPRSRG